MNVGEGVIPFELRRGEGRGCRFAKGSQQTNPKPAGRWQLTGLCLGQWRASAPSRPRTGWTAVTPRSPLSSATTGAAASTQGSPRCPGASSLCRRRVSHPQAPGPFWAGAGASGSPGSRPPLGPGQDPQCHGCSLAEASVSGFLPGQPAASSLRSCFQAVCAKI